MALSTPLKHSVSHCAVLVAVALGAVGARAQGLRVSPETSAVGQQIRVIVEDATGAEVLGVPVAVKDSSGNSIVHGATGPTGMTFSIETPGTYRIESLFAPPLGDGSRLVRTYVVRDSARRWLFATVWVALGIVLLAANVRRWQRTESVTPPSRPGP